MTIWRAAGSEALQPLLANYLYRLYGQAWRPVSTSACSCGFQLRPPQSTGEEREGAKTTIFRVLESAEGPLTTAQIWSELEGAENVKSKRFMKQMLLQMKKSNYVRSVANVEGKSFGYTPADRRPPSKDTLGEQEQAGQEAQA